MIQCCFGSCKNQATLNHTKCSVHRNREMCRIPKCVNQVYARNRCVRHGGRRRCYLHGCNVIARLNGMCSKHANASRRDSCEVVEKTDNVFSTRLQTEQSPGNQTHPSSTSTMEECDVLQLNDLWINLLQAEMHQTNIKPKAEQSTAKDLKWDMDKLFLETIIQVTANRPETPSTSLIHGD